MPPLTGRKHDLPSSELGDGDFDVSFNARTGRPLRKARRIQEDSPFVDSAIAVTDPAESDATESDNSTISVAKRRKRRRSPSPPLSDLSCIDGDLSDVSDTGRYTARSAQALTCGNAVQITFKNLVVNVPPGHTGPLLLQLEMPSQAPKQSLLVNGMDATRSRYPKQSGLRSHQGGRQSSAINSSYAGFLDLPAEIRNQVYQHVFVAPEHFNFDSPSNFSRGSAFLRTCREVYEEGRSILYSENHFLFVRKTRRHGSYWEREWNEVGFKAVWKFLRIIGRTNIGLIRRVTLLLEDATPCLNPDMLTADDRRFVYDDVLISVLRRLADHSKLERLDLHFHGRRRVERTDRRFLETLTAVKADFVNFIRTPPGTTYPSESKQDSAVEKMCLEAMVRRKKLYN